MSGTYKYQTTSGQTRWRIVYDVAPDPLTGKRRQTGRRGFATQKEAKAALRELETRVSTGTHIDHTGMTVAQYLARWVEGIQVKPTTRSNYRTCIDVHLVPIQTRDGQPRPGIGGVKLQALTPEHLDVLYRWLELEGKRTKDGGQPLATKSIRHVHVCIRKALADAVERSYVLRNVADLAHPPSKKAARSRKAVDDVWSAQQLRAFLTAAEGDDFHALFHLAAMTGMRRAELLGLRWDDVDLDRGELRVRWTVTEVRGRPIEQDGTKTDAGERTIALDGATAHVLRLYRRQQLEQRMLAGSGWEDEVGRVFTNAVGRLLKPRTVLERLYRIGDATGLPRIGVHGLRHSYATAALRAGVNIDVLAERLGHADPSVTLKVYAHVLGGDDKSAADQAARAILG